MLRFLRIRNFAIIDELELQFHGGFNVITGETGAGKSIILDAIGLILGNRANAELIREGFDEATVEAIFDVGQNDFIDTKLAARGLRAQDHELIVRRTIHRSGKSRIFLNGELVTLSQLSEICGGLVELCSQHENQSLVKSSFQLELLDRYGGLFERRREIRELYSALKSIEAELYALDNAPAHLQKEDFIRFQINEIDNFQPQESEEQTLLTERKRLLNASSLIEASQSALCLLDSIGGDDAISARDLLTKARQKIQKAVESDDSLYSVIESIDRALLEIEESVSNLSSYAERIEADPSKLDAIERRLSKWQEIKRKYGNSFEEIIKARENLENELNTFASRQKRISDLKAKLNSLQEEYDRIAQGISEKRKNVSGALSKSVQKELQELNMPSAKFQTEFDTTNAATPEGFDRVQFLFSPNKGESTKPIHKIASGGELSRVMLSIRRTIADKGCIGVYLFDEIDTGIGGQTASVVGKKLASVAKFNQVICITHLPQVAAYANAHFSVTKKVSANRTTTQIAVLSGQKRTEEIARMLGGLNITEKSRAHAKDLLEQALGE